jgi:hypothetical protein
VGGLISFVPGPSQVGIHTITVRATDFGGLSDEQSFSLTVTNVNDPPSISSTPVTTAIEEVLYSYTLAATDPRLD